MQQLENLNKKERMREYISSCLATEDYDNKPLSTDREKLIFFVKCFNLEYRHQIKRLGFIPALKEYLSGLPSCVNMVFYNSDILEIGYKLELIDKTKYSQKAQERREQKFIENWFLLCAYTLFDLVHLTKISSRKVEE